MTSFEDADWWAHKFGLALAPLFEGELEAQNEHHVLLDGGHGSFALSITDEKIWREKNAASWVWSSNLPHHVTVTKSEVAVVRWDNPTPQLLTRGSVERQAEAFYRFLVSDRIRSSQRVVDHMVILFRRIRALLADANVPDDRSVDAYLAFLARLASTMSHLQAAPLDGTGQEILGSLSASGLQTLLSDALRTETFSSALKLFPSLAIRHAGSEIFQEAHFELLRASGPDLLGYVAPAESRRETRGGAHFTPPAVARSIAEQGLLHFGDLTNRANLIILDPACGSGAFLHEALRTLRRVGFQGRLELIGRDVSMAAASMASFVLRAAVLDWQPAGGCQIDIRLGDSFDDDLPQADIVLMNPPFVAWSALTDAQREQMQRVLGSNLQGRGDYSMAFVTRALDALAPGGVLGTLIPASLLTLRSAESWRADLLTKSGLRFIASLEYGLFAYALVQVAALVLRKGQSSEDQQVTALISSNDPDATGNALRSLRRGAGQDAERKSWQLFQIPQVTLHGRPTWRLLPPRAETELRRVIEVGGAVHIKDLFDVKQGVRTGANPTFVISPEELRKLPSRERRWFRPAVMNDSVHDGKLIENHFVFYPYEGKDDAFTDEAQLKKAAATYYDKFLRHERDKLRSRSGIRGGEWWMLSRRRASWALTSTPRIVSKYFGSVGGFAVDLEARFIVVQGFAWIPLWPEPESEGALASLPRADLLLAFSAMFNSSTFGEVLQYFSPHVAGGQFDFSPRYVDVVPVPNLPALVSSERFGTAIAELIALGRSPETGNAAWRRTVDRITAQLYGSKFLADG